MNTAPNRRASDNASSPPGTSPTRHFSDMLKESSGSGGGGGVELLTLSDEVVPLKTGNIVVEFGKIPFIQLSMDFDPRNCIVKLETFDEDGSGVTVTLPEYYVNDIQGVDPTLVPPDEYTLAEPSCAISVSDFTNQLLLPASAKIINGTKTPK